MPTSSSPQHPSRSHAHTSRRRTPYVPDQRYVITIYERNTYTKDCTTVRAEAIAAAIAAASAVSPHGSAPPPQIGLGRTPKGRLAISGVCGVRTYPLNLSFIPISAIPPPSCLPIDAWQGPKACARCGIQKRRPVDIKNHFRHCVATHGNPLGRYWGSDETFEDEN